ncbi:hypothetical protein EGW08_005778, partial [Elysia chlorotica]
VFSRSSYKSPINTYYLLEDLCTIQCIHCTLSFFESFIFNQCIALSPIKIQVQILDFTIFSKLFINIILLRLFMNTSHK